MRLRRIALAVALLVPAAAAAAAIVEWPIPGVLRDRIEETVERFLDARIRYDDGRISLAGGVRLSGVVLEGSTGGRIVAASADVGVPPSALVRVLLGGAPPAVGSIRLRGADLTVERDTGGRLVLPVEPRGGADRFVVRMEKARLRLADRPLGLSATIEGVEGDVTLGARPDGRWSGPIPGASGGHWTLAVTAVPESPRTVAFDLRIRGGDGAKACDVRGRVSGETGGTVAGRITAALEAAAAARLFGRRGVAGAATIEARLEVAPRAVRLEGEARAARLEGAGLALEDLRARFAADAAGIEATEVAATLGGGRLAAHGTLAWADPDRWRLAGRLDGADAAALARAVPGGPAVGGFLAAAFLFEGNPEAPFGALGAVRAAVESGALDPASLGAADLPGATAFRPLRFDRFSAEILLGLDGAVARRIELRSTLLDARGEILVDTAGRLSGRGILLLAEALAPSFLRGDAGGIAARMAREGDRFLFPVAVGGTIGAPTIALDRGARSGR